MSRIGKLPVDIPAGVTITVGDKEITVAGPKGTLAVPVQDNTTTKVEGNQIIVTRKDDEPKSRAWHGLQRALLNNAVTGVTKGFEKKLEINGVGYRLSGGPKEIEMALGFSHPVKYKAPEGVDEMFRPSCDDKLVWILLGEHHGITDDVSPQSARGADHHGVVHARLHAPERHDFRIGFAKFAHRYEFIEHSVVNHQRHGRVVDVGLYAEESLRCVVGLHIDHVGIRDDFLVLFTVRGESHSSMEENLEVWPDIVEILLSCYLHHPGEHSHHP